jgi:hypothetical protein
MYGNNQEEKTYEVDAKVSFRFKTTSISAAYKEFEACMRKLFDEDVFMEMGYEGTSVQQIVEQPKVPNLLTGIGGPTGIMK